MVVNSNSEIPSVITYDEAKAFARHEDIAVRQELASRSDVGGEILYFLSEDSDPNVRSTVAANKATPAQADIRLVNDNDVEVRTTLAEKISRLAPGLTPAEQSRVGQRTFEALRHLVRDEATRVRQIMSDVLKDAVDAPHEIVATLARDFEVLVSGPVLEHSPVLTDDDLVEIIANDPIAGALNAIAVRSSVSSVVSAAIVASEDREAVANLLANKNAQILEDTLDRILDHAPNEPSWHEPLVRRPVLPEHAAARIASFVAEQLLEVLHQRTDLAPGVLAAVDFEFRRRAHGEVVSVPVGEDEDKMLIALDAGDQEYVLSVLARRAGTTPQSIGKLIAGAEAKALVALAWKADYTMAVALRLQSDLAHIGTDKIIGAGEAGEFPMTDEDMRWELYFHGVV